MENWAPLEMSAEQRKQWANARIAELTPLEQAAVEKLNATLSDEQHVRRLNASESGRRFGLTGRELFLHVLSALELTDEQKSALSEARKELRTIREAIAPHLALMLDDEQRERMLEESNG